MNHIFVRLLKKTSRSLLVYVAGGALLTTAAVVLSLLGTLSRVSSLRTPGGVPITTRGAYSVPTAHKSGWGESAIKTLATWSPIRVANACGMGASSCFKCHNSGRGPAISNDAWHADHEQVNNDCVGCHQGSPYLLKKSLAHAGLIADPRLVPAKACATCHQSANLKTLVAAYMKAGVPPKKTSAPPQQK